MKNHINKLCLEAMYKLAEELFDIISCFLLIEKEKEKKKKRKK